MVGGRETQAALETPFVCWPTDTDASLYSKVFGIWPGIKPQDGCTYIYIYILYLYLKEVLMSLRWHGSHAFLVSSLGI